MSLDPHRDILGIPSLSEKDHRPYIDLIDIAISWAVKHKNAPPRITDPEADFVVYISFLVSKTEWWISRFRDSQRKAGRFYRDPDTYWRTIAIGVTHPKALEECKKLLPSLDPEKYLITPALTPAPQKITPEAAPTSRSRIQETPEETKPELGLVKRPLSLNVAMRLCTAWRLDPRWEKLYPCSTQLFYRLIFRTYRKDTFGKIKKALASGRTFFPWCCSGLDSLSKQLTYHPASSTRMKHYERQQIGRALRQLWNLGFVHRIFRGYEEQGAGKYHVFLNPKMSARFNKSAIDVKRGSTSKKRRSRMG